MTKRNFTAYLDTELVNIALTQGLNISQEFNDFLKMRVMNMGKDANPTKEAVESLKKEKEDLKNRILIIDKEIGSNELAIKHIVDEDLKKALKEAFR